MALAIAAFDRPEGIVPTIQWGVEGKLPYVDHVSELPGEDQWPTPRLSAFLADLVSYQHPDHDTKPGHRRKKDEQYRQDWRLPVRGRSLRIHGELGRPRSAIAAMCQKQFGSFFSALVTAPKDGVEWIRAEPSYFQSSVNIDRGFCRNAVADDLSASRRPRNRHRRLRRPLDLAPKIQVNYSPGFPGSNRSFEQPVHHDPDYYGRRSRSISFQHPDHEDGAVASRRSLGTNDRTHLQPAAASAARCATAPRHAGRSAYLSCRMCQKGGGQLLLPLANIAREDFRIVRGQPAWYRSSDLVRRGFWPRLRDALSMTCRMRAF